MKIEAKFVQAINIEDFLSPIRENEDYEGKVANI